MQVFSRTIAILFGIRQREHYAHKRLRLMETRLDCVDVALWRTTFSGRAQKCTLCAGNDVEHESLSNKIKGTYGYQA